MSITRVRLNSNQSRAAAVAAAKRILLAQGPQAVTLKAVASEIGQTHGNLLHHFGSAAGLQAALARAIADEVTGSIASAVEAAREGKVDPRAIVDRTFDAFSEQGAGALAAWMILSGNRDALNPILEAIRDLVEQLSAGHEGHHVPELTLSLVLAALGNALLGPAISDALGLAPDAARETAAETLRARIAATHPHG